MSEQVTCWAADARRWRRLLEGMNTEKGKELTAAVDKSLAARPLLDDAERYGGEPCLSR